MESPIRSSGEAKRIRDAEEKGNGVSAFPVSDLPLVILLEIFLKLPILAVIQCKSVCKAWYNLISDPIFFTNYTKNPIFTTLMISRPTLAGDGRTVFSLLEVSEDGVPIRTPVSLNLTNHPTERSFDLLITDSCNGFICLNHFTRKMHTIYVRNPLTGECISLPQRKLENGALFASYKLEFSPSVSKFKVLRFAFGMELQIIEIFTVGTDTSWRRLPSWKERFGVGRGASLHGVLHWIVTNEGPLSIFTFDLEEEKAGSRISVPSGLVEQDWRCVYLKALDDRLCIVDFSVESQLTLWKMNEYGVGESWTKLVILGSCFPSELGIHVVTTLPNGAIVLKGRKEFTLVAYYPKDKTCFEIKVPGRKVVFSDVIPYEPAFSPLKRLKLES